MTDTILNIVGIFVCVFIAVVIFLAIYYTVQGYRDTQRLRPEKEKAEARAKEHRDRMAGRYTPRERVNERIRHNANYVPSTEGTPDGDPPEPRKK